MRGQEKIIAMRLSGKAPNMVFLNDYPTHREELDWFENGLAATVQTSPQDAPERLDLRFLVGLKVSVSSDDENRAKAIFEACKKAGAKTVAACHVYRVSSEACRAGWSQVHHG